jgi:hypothetical protein
LGKKFSGALLKKIKKNQKKSKNLMQRFIIENSLNCPKRKIVFFSVFWGVKFLISGQNHESTGLFEALAH